MDDEFPEPPQPRLTPARGNGRMVVLGLVVAALLGAAGALWGGKQLGWIAWGVPDRAAARVLPAVPTPAVATPPAVTAASDPSETTSARLAELEQRMARLGLEAEAASGNAARAEGLLIAVTTRRAVERGAPLGYLEEQLKLRFGAAQPNAVATLIEAAGNPVTLDILEQGLSAIAPALERPPADANLWTRVRGELAQLFVIRRVGSPSPEPRRRYERARLFLEGGRVEAAIGEVERMPGRVAAQDWLALARRYIRAQRALDLIETAAILDPQRLPDGSSAPMAADGAIANPVH